MVDMMDGTTNTLVQKNLANFGCREYRAKMMFLFGQMTGLCSLAVITLAMSKARALMKLGAQPQDQRDANGNYVFHSFTIRAGEYGGKSNLQQCAEYVGVNGNNQGTSATNHFINNFLCDGTIGLGAVPHGDNPVAPQGVAGRPGHPQKEAYLRREFKFYLKDCCTMGSTTFFSCGKTLRYYLERNDQWTRAYLDSLLEDENKKLLVDCLLFEEEMRTDSQLESLDDIVFDEFLYGKA